MQNPTNLLHAVKYFTLATPKKPVNLLHAMNSSKQAKPVKLLHALNIACKNWLICYMQYYVSNFMHMKTS